MPVFNLEMKKSSNLLYLLPFQLNDKIVDSFFIKSLMKSHIVALSVALACTGAFAQSKSKSSDDSMYVSIGYQSGQYTNTVVSQRFSEESELLRLEF